MVFFISYICLFIATTAIIGAIVMAIKRNPAWKKWLLCAIGSIAVMVISLGLYVVTYRSASIPLPLEPVSSGMTRLAIPDVGSIDIPNTMELQSESSKSMNTDLGMPTDKDDFIVMQKEPGNYSRIIVHTNKGKPSDYLKLTQKYSATAKDLASVSQVAKDNVNNEIELIPNMRMLDWYTPKIELVNGMSAFVVSYRTQLGDQPPVISRMYRFQNYDRTITLTMSYRETEKKLWEPAFKKSLNSFRITNIISK